MAISMTWSSAAAHPHPSMQPLAERAAHDLLQGSGSEHQPGGQPSRSNDSTESSDWYHFEYAVHDPVSGDVKNHNEYSDGHGTVKGIYSLIEPDGSARVVEYTADDVHGFVAKVKKIERQPKGDVDYDDSDEQDEKPFYPTSLERAERANKQ